MTRTELILRKLRNALLALPLLAVCLSSCQREELDQIPGTPEEAPGFYLRASIFNNAPEGLSGRTKAPKGDNDTSVQAGDEVAAMDALRENYLGSLDIFVKESDAAETTPWFKTYHFLPDDPEAGFTSGEDIKLHDNWAEAGYRPGVSYDIYIAANNPHTLAGSAPANLAALKALTTTDGSIYKYYTTETDDNVPYGQSNMTLYPGSHEKAGRPKEFRMDCTITGWKVDINSPRQVFDAQLQRDVAKIIIRVRYGNQENIPLVSEDGSESVKEDGTDRIKNASLKDYLLYIGRTGVGTPRWKYNNFCFTDGDFASSDLDDGIDLRSYSSSMMLTRDDELPENNDIYGLEYWHYTLVTYSAPFSWEGSVEKTPFVLYSVMFTNPTTDEAGRGKLYYYRLPVCDERVVHSLDRNHIYLVDVSICSLGSENENFKLDDSELRIEYHVIPWTEHEVAQNATTTVLVSDTQYLSVSPEQYTLKGNDTQSVTLNYFASLSPVDGRFLDIANTSTQLKVEYENYQHTTKTITGTVTKQVQTGENSYAVANSSNNDGRKPIIITSKAPGSAGSPDSSTGTQGETVEVVITPDGTITISSQALENRAVKKITFTVTLLTSGLSRTIVIKHAPLDNIKNIQGWFSYKIDSDREYSFNPSADGWSSWDGYEDGVVCTQAEYNSAEPAYRYTSVELTAVEKTQTQFKSALTNNTDRASANSQANAVNGWWGSGTIYHIGYRSAGNNTTTNQGPAYYYDGYDNSWSYDYYVREYDSSYGRYYFEYYKYEKYYHLENATVYRARRYFKYAEEVTNWVIWNRDSQTRYATSKTVKDHMMEAKVHDGGSIYNIEESGNAGNYIATHSSTASNYTNRQMYVIQLTSASTDYAIGYPVISDYESQDNVVSPAFMLASQLGALSTIQPLSFDNAKEHCGKYIEVDDNGYVYRNWRLPTVGEIQTIINYQGSTNTKNITMATVLTGRYYWALDGSSPLANVSDTREYYWVRCVRDLTLEELEALNN